MSLTASFGTPADWSRPISGSLAKMGMAGGVRTGSANDDGFTGRLGKTTVIVSPTRDDRAVSHEATPPAQARPAQGSGQAVDRTLEINQLKTAAWNKAFHAYATGYIFGVKARRLKRDLACVTFLVFLRRYSSA